MIENKDIHIFLNATENVLSYYCNLEVFKHNIIGGNDIWISVLTNNNKIFCGLGENNFIGYGDEKVEDLFINHALMINRPVTMFLPSFLFINNYIKFLEILNDFCNTKYKIMSNSYKYNFFSFNVYKTKYIKDYEVNKNFIYTIEDRFLLDCDKKPSHKSKSNIYNFLKENNYNNGDFIKQILGKK